MAKETIPVRFTMVRPEIFAVEGRINRRFKRQGRSWSRRGAEYLAQLLWLQTNPLDGITGGSKLL